jgi:putative glutamine amidotransferase
MLAHVVRTHTLTTGARHHQGVERCADDLRIVGRTADGVVEALEATFDSPFWLAVQWHPESTRDSDDGASRRIFTAFVLAAGGSG